MKEMQRHVDVLLRALDILDAFQVQPSFTLKEIISLTKMNRSRAMRLMGTLESRAYLFHDTENRKYLLGPKLLTLGKIFEANNLLISISRPMLRDLVKMTGEMASLYVVDGLDRVALIREKGAHEISYTVSEGQRMELYAGAAGKVLLAFAPQEIQQQVLRKTFLKKLTSSTISDPKRLSRELEVIRQKKFAVSAGERAPDVWSVAAPVFEYKAKLCCAIGITGPIYRISKSMQSEYSQMVIAKADELTRLLGGHESGHLEEEKP